MRSSILSEAFISLGLVTWLLSATILPFHLGLGGAGWQAFAGYVVVAGALFAIGDAVLGVSYLCSPRDIAGMGVMKSLGLAIPAATMFALGIWLAPTATNLDDDVCRMGGYATVQSTQAGTGIDLDPDADCLPVSAGAHS